MQQRDMRPRAAAARPCQPGPADIGTTLMLEVTWSLASSVLYMEGLGCEERP